MIGAPQIRRPVFSTLTNSGMLAYGVQSTRSRMTLLSWRPTMAHNQPTPRGIDQ